jgi:hypothetical protein
VTRRSKTIEDTFAYQAAVAGEAMRAFGRLLLEKFDRLVYQRLFRQRRT